MEKIKSHPRISYNFASAYNWDLNHNIEFCVSAGITDVVLALPRLGEPAREGIAKIRGAGLHCVSMAGGIDPLIEDADKTLDTLKPLIDASSALSCPSCYCLTGPAPPKKSTDHAFNQLITTLGLTNDYANSKNVRFGIEHNSISTRCNGFINTLVDAVDLSKETGTGICVELQNCWYERHLPRVFRENVDRFLLVQFSDFVVGEPLLYNRAVPGDGDIPLEWLIKSVLDAGYNGYFDLEILGPRIEKESYEAAIKRGIEWLSERLQIWGV